MTTGVEAALQHHLQRLLATAGVAGAAVGERDGQPCITVYVDPDAPPPAPAGLPLHLDGYPVVVEPAGPFRAVGPG